MYVMCWCFFFFVVYCDHRDLHVRTLSFPTRRSSDFADEADHLRPIQPQLCRQRGVARRRIAEQRQVDAVGRHQDLARINPTPDQIVAQRSEEHTSELQSLMRISYAVFCLKKKKQKHNYRAIR